MRTPPNHPQAGNDSTVSAAPSHLSRCDASVVIHYDRWWNSAREDQATDRVHRIGQTRGVQVFKFVTEGTLEEKIDAIINRKRALLKDLVGEDDGGALKSLTREEFLELLAAPKVL